MSLASGCLTVAAGLLAVSTGCAWAQSCADGPQAAALETVTALPVPLTTPDALREQSLSFQPVTEATGIAYSAGDAGTEWKVWQGNMEIAKHEAMCIAGDPIMADQLRLWQRSAERSTKIGRTLVVLGGLLTLVTVADLVYDGAISTRGYVLLGVGAGFAVPGLAVGLEGLKLRRRYRTEPMPSYAAGVFRRYNEALAHELEKRPDD